MIWYKNMTKLQKKQFRTVIVACMAGSILLLSVPVIFRLIF